MYKFKFGIRVYIINFILIFLIFGAFETIKSSLNVVFQVLLLVALVLELISPINLFFSCTIIDYIGITQRSLFKKKHISWDKVTNVVQQPANILSRISLGVYGTNIKISITSLTKDYKELIELILAKCKQNDKTQIDYSILKSVEEI